MVEYWCHQDAVMLLVAVFWRIADIESIQLGGCVVTLQVHCAA